MSVVSLIPAHAGLIDEIDSLLGHDERDYSENIVVFPGKRPAHALRKALSKKRSGGFLPPKIFSIDNFIDYLFREKLNISERTLESLDAAAILYEIHLADTLRIGGNNFTSLDSFLPLGIKIFGELEELWIANIPLPRVREALSGITYSGVTSLLVFFEQFYSSAVNRGFATRSMKYRTVAEKITTIDFDEYSKIVVAGFFALTNSEQTILRHLNALDNVVLIFQNGPGVGNQLRKLGVSPEVPPQGESRPSFHFYQSADTHGQVFALTNKVDELKQRDGDSLDRTVVVLPAAETLFPVFHQTLALIPDNEYTYE